MKFDVFKKLLLLSIMILTCQTACKKFLEISPPKDSLSTKVVFENDDVATSAVTGIYNRMSNGGWASGNSASITSVCGLSADEFLNNGTALTEFYENRLTETNNILSTYLWTLPYQNIYAANSILEQLPMSKSITPSVSSQLTGEAHFIRAFCYFYLVNLFGPVPLHVTTDYRTNSSAFRTPVDKVYIQILNDLKAAETLLTDTYVTTERVRPNLGAVQALLARTYLYVGDWENAEEYATKVIDKSKIYDLVSLNSIFLKNSKECIWQLMPTTNVATNEGGLFILTTAPLYGTLRPTFVSGGFEVGDNRKADWIRTFTNTSGTYYYPYKYKVKTGTSLTEYSMVMRLAEQFLIRAEARTKLNNIDGAIDDIDKIRKRAGLLLIKNTNPNISKEALLTAIQKERYTELFSEWGHRWFDLKRTNTANATLSQLKPNWVSTDVLYPLPQTEVSRNQNLSQNEGY